MRGRRLEQQLAAQLAEDLGGRYEVTTMLGRGGMGEVWAAFDRRMDRQVAIKVLDAELSGDADFRERFRREGKTLAQLSHRRIVHVFDFGTLPSDDRLYMVMQRLSGRTLRAILAKRRAEGHVLEAATAALYAVQLLDALGAAHEQGIIHRDVKPENTIVDGRGEAHPPRSRRREADGDHGARAEHRHPLRAAAARRADAGLGAARYAALHGARADPARAV